MSGTDTSPDTVAFLREIAGELAEIHRAKHYLFWRSETQPRVDQYLSSIEPFSHFATCWVFRGDDSGSLLEGRLGGWVIDRLVEKIAPEDIIALFTDEVARNVAVYEDVSPVFGIKITEACELDEGIRLVPHNLVNVFSRAQQYPLWPHIPTETGFLIQPYTVSPAFEPRPADTSEHVGRCITQPVFSVRDAIRHRCRLACLLASDGCVELPVSAIQADPRAFLSVGGTIISGRPFAAYPPAPFPADVAIIKTLFRQLATFAEGDKLIRAIDRIGRSRLAIHAVDRALDLGMAAEIVLMHDLGTSNTEITYKIASRAAWFLGEDANERAKIFDEIKHLYAARSDAVHKGELSQKSKVDLDRADQLVVRVVRAILERGSFPDWANLTMGGGG